MVGDGVHPEYVAGLIVHIVLRSGRQRPTKVLHVLIEGVSIASGRLFRARLHGATSQGVGGWGREGGEQRGEVGCSSGGWLRVAGVGQAMVTTPAGDI